MTAPILFAYGTYLAALFCIVFCIREWVSGGWKHGLWQLVILFAFMVLFWLLESWAGIRAPFYDYDPGTVFPHRIDRFDFSTLGSLLGSIGMSGFSSLLGPGPAAASICAIPLTPDMPLCIPVAGGCIVFSLLWTVRLLMGSEGFVKEPFAPVFAPLIVGLMALWMDLLLDPVLANSFDCNAIPEQMHEGLAFWTWHTNASLADFWFHVPLYNYGTWFAAPAILAALVIFIQWLYLKFVLGVAVSNADGAIRTFILLMAAVVFFISPNAANSIPLIYFVVLVIIALGLIALIREWPGFRRNNEWRWELIATQSFYLLFPIFGFLLTGHFVFGDHIWLFLLALFVAGWGIFFSTSPYWKLATAIPIAPVLLAIVMVVALLGYLGNS